MHSSEAALQWSYQPIWSQRITIIMGIFDVYIVKNETVTAFIQFSNFLQNVIMLHTKWLKMLSGRALFLDSENTLLFVHGFVLHSHCGQRVVSVVCSALLCVRWQLIGDLGQKIYSNLISRCRDINKLLIRIASVVPFNTIIGIMSFSKVYGNRFHNYQFPRGS